MILIQIIKLKINIKKQSPLLNKDWFGSYTLAE